ncbi:MAG: response regulator [Bacteroidota bacterium]
MNKLFSSDEIYSHLEGTRKALVVEDNFILSLLYENSLKELVFNTVGEISDAETAVELVKEHDPALVIMDIVLDGKRDGIDAAEAIRTFSNVPILFVTGNSDKHHFERAKQIQNSDFLRKPVTEHSLTEAVKVLLKKQG